MINPTRNNSQHCDRLSFIHEGRSFSFAAIKKKEGLHHKIQYFFENLFGTRYAELKSADTPQLLNLRSVAKKLKISVSSAKELIKSSNRKQFKEKIHIGAVAHKILVDKKPSPKRQLLIPLIMESIYKHAIYEEREQVYLSSKKIMFQNLDGTKKPLDHLLISESGKQYMITFVNGGNTLSNIVISRVGRKILGEAAHGKISSFSKSGALKLPTKTSTKRHKGSIAANNLELKTVGERLNTLKEIMKDSQYYDTSLLKNSQSITYLDQATQATTYGILMPRAECDLSDYLKKPGITYVQKLSIAQRLLFQLKDLHESRATGSVLHGDIKLENILMIIDEKGDLRPLIADFDHSGYQLPEAGNPQDFVVTPPQALDPLYCVELERETAKTGSDSSIKLQRFQKLDVFAMGCVLYELFQEGHTHPYPDLQKTAEDFKATSLPQSIPSDLCELIMKMISLRPESRPSANEAFNQISIIS